MFRNTENTEKIAENLIFAIQKQKISKKIVDTFVQEE